MSAPTCSRWVSPADGASGHLCGLLAVYVVARGTDDEWHACAGHRPTDYPHELVADDEGRELDADDGDTVAW